MHVNTPTYGVISTTATLRLPFGNFEAIAQRLRPA